MEDYQGILKRWNIETLLKSDSKPISFLDTSLAIIQSQFFSDNFFKELFFIEFVSAAKPTTNLGLSEL